MSWIQINNDATFKFMYLVDQKRKKKKRNAYGEVFIVSHTQNN